MDALHRSVSRGIRGAALRSALLAVLAAIVIAAPAAALSGWTGPTRIASASLADPWIGVDSAGKLHVVGFDAAGLVYRTNRTGSWTSVSLYAETALGVGDLSATMRSDGKVSIAWVHDGAMLYLTNANGGSNHGWPTSPKTLVASGASWPALAMHGSKIHLAYLSGDGHIRYRTNASGAWIDTGLSNTQTYRVSIAVDSTGHAWIAWTDRTPAGIRYAVNVGSNSHPSWNRHTVPGTGCTAIACDGWLGGPSLQLDGRDFPRLSWARVSYGGPALTADSVLPSTVAAGAPGLYYVRYLGGGAWTAGSNRRISSDAGDGVGPTLLLDANGRAHIQYAIGNTVGRVLYLSNTSGAFVRTQMPDLAMWWAMALTPGGKARVLLTDLVTAGNGTFLMKEN